MNKTGILFFLFCFFLLEAGQFLKPSAGNVKKPLADALKKEIMEKKVQSVSKTEQKIKAVENIKGKVAQVKDKIKDSRAFKMAGVKTKLGLLSGSVPPEVASYFRQAQKMIGENSTDEELERAKNLMKQALADMEMPGTKAFSDEGNEVLSRYERKLLLLKKSSSADKGKIAEFEKKLNEFRSNLNMGVSDSMAKSLSESLDRTGMSLVSRKAEKAAAGSEIIDRMIAVRRRISSLNLSADEERAYTEQLDEVKQLYRKGRKEEADQMLSLLE